MGMGLADWYVAGVSVLFFVPKLLVVFPLMLLLTAPGFLATRLYMRFQTNKKKCVLRCPRTAGLYLACWLGFFPLFLPAILLFYANLLADLAIFHVSGILYCALGWRWAAMLRGRRALANFNYGEGVLGYLPGYPNRFVDAMIAVMGSQARQSFCEGEFFSTGSSKKLNICVCVAAE